MGHNPYSVSLVSGIDGDSWYTERLHGISQAFQVRKHAVEAQRFEPSNVLTKRPSGSCLRYNSTHFSPERAVIVLASSLPKLTVWLARKSTCKKCDSFVVFTVEVMDVFDARDSPPVSFEDSLAESVLLAERDRLISRPSCGDGEPPDSTEEVEVCFCFFIHLILSLALASEVFHAVAFVDERLLHGGIA